MEWDEELQPTEQARWLSLFREMEQLNDVEFQRCITPIDTVGKPMLCIFSDAPEAAFGACVYVRWQLSNGDYQVQFVTAKSRVAPLKKLSVPRLELQAAVMATRLYTAVKEEMKLQVGRTVFMTDSTIVLAWIRSQARGFKQFVSVRIGEILTKSDPGQWKHVPGDMNPADDISRGVSVKELMYRWTQGPEFLYTSEEN